MRGGDKDRIGGDPVHVDTRARLDVVHVYVSVLGDEVDDVILGRHLHRDREVVLRLRREENIHGFLWERLVARGCLANLCERSATFTYKFLSD